MSFNFLNFLSIHYLNMYIIPTESLFVSEVQRLSSRYSIAALEILCVTGGTPPTYFRWYKDGIPLISDEDKITITATVTNRTMSTYDILLVLEDIPDNIVGIYEIEVGSDMQNANHKIAAAVKGNFIDTIITQAC